MSRVEAYVDASFANHIIDGKSHMGVMVMVGKTAILFASRKQKCVSKSLTEAELVALSDNVGFVEIFGGFLSFIVNWETEIPKVYKTIPLSFH